MSHRKQNIENIKTMVRAATPSGRYLRHRKWFYEQRKRLSESERRPIAQTLWDVRHHLRNSDPDKRVLVLLERLEKNKTQLNSKILGHKGGRPPTSKNKEIVKKIIRLKNSDRILSLEEIYEEVAGEFDENPSNVQQIFTRHKKKTSQT